MEGGGGRRGRTVHPCCPFHQAAAYEEEKEG